MRWSALTLGVLLLAQGAGKLLAPSGYAAALAAFRALPSVWPVAIAWIAVELASGAGLVAAGLRRGPWLPPAIGAAIVTVGYAALDASAWMRGIPVENCTCFGVYLTQRLSPFVLAQEAVMLVYVGWMVVTAARSRRADRRRSRPAPRGTALRPA